MQQPVRCKHSIALESNYLRLAVSSMQGWRTSMEDAHITELDLPLPAGAPPPPTGPSSVAASQKSSPPPILSGGTASTASLWGVYDGHCGHVLAHQVSAGLTRWITQNNEAFKKGKYSEALQTAYLYGDVELTRTFGVTEMGGSTANTVFIADGVIYCANSGDSRSVLCRRGTAFDLSVDHKPTDAQEQERVKKAGGFVYQGRIAGTLAVSRGFGDFAFKNNPSLSAENQMVTVLPDVNVVPIEADDEFIVTACDGIWECMSSEDVIKFVRNEISSHGDLALACENLADACISPEIHGMKGKGLDNMTVLVAEFKAALLATGKSVCPMLPAAPRVVTRTPSVSMLKHAGSPGSVLPAPVVQPPNQDDIAET